MSNASHIGGPLGGPDHGPVHVTAALFSHRADGWEACTGRRIRTTRSLEPATSPAVSRSAALAARKGQRRNDGQATHGDAAFATGNSLPRSTAPPDCCRKMWQRDGDRVQALGAMARQYHEMQEAAGCEIGLAWLAHLDPRPSLRIWVTTPVNANAGRRMVVPPAWQPSRAVEASVA
ncbi:hypothetical protein GGTG_12082 [Gaeumannomyces tritici R3-111a-1]|uniref:Uncharacterized protein n=1 Tax=Gaeumannomyces tritici (strain R3-111a-1) TaxID=644352 RepID=J3PF03_GAET3|nr:hypothetical protein GGTG_12082 [Gaeumannomyces tritici R3-111a-1]EJT71061.1 hypothetical protein GGTG_12082 [Gaeumannomyces tritici R3-111a-1]